MATTVGPGSDNGRQPPPTALTNSTRKGHPRACETGGMESVLPYVLAIVPTVGVAVLFYFVIKTILEGDRRERLAQAKWEAEHDRREQAQKPADGGVAMKDISTDAGGAVNGSHGSDASGTDHARH